MLSQIPGVNVENKRNRKERKKTGIAPKTKSEVAINTEALEARTAAMIQQTQLRFTSGPMPSADELAGYERVLPGIAERLMRIHETHTSLMANQVTHRIAMEKNVIQGDGKRSWTGLFLGAILVLAVLVWSYKLAINGQPILAGVGVFSDLGMLAGVFVYGNNSRKAERQDRLKLLMKDKAEQSQKDNGQMALIDTDEF